VGAIPRPEKAGRRAITLMFRAILCRFSLWRLPVGQKPKAPGKTPFHVSVQVTTARACADMSHGCVPWLLSEGGLVPSPWCPREAVPRGPIKASDPVVRSFPLTTCWRSHTHSGQHLTPGGVAHVWSGDFRDFCTSPPGGGCQKTPAWHGWLPGRGLGCLPRCRRNFASPLLGSLAG
jgi:hypothetical protein